MSYSKNMTKKSKKTIHLGELPQAELEILRNQDPDVLATALIFVIGELIVQEYDIDQQPEIHKIVKEAAMQAIELVDFQILQRGRSIERKSTTNIRRQTT